MGSGGVNLERTWESLLDCGKLQDTHWYGDCTDVKIHPAESLQFFFLYLESESEVAQSCPTLCDPMDCSLPASFLHGILQARVLEWVAISYASIIKQSKKKPPPPQNGNKIIYTIVIITCLENYRKIWNDKNQILNKLLMEGLGRERDNESVVSS